jgi:hypothetical protein
MERRPFGATFIAAEGLSRGGAIVSEMISSGSVLLAFPTNLKKRRVITPTSQYSWGSIHFS